MPGDTLRYYFVLGMWICGMWITNVQGCRSRRGEAIAPPVFGRSFNPIRTRARGILYPPYYYRPPPQIFDAASLMWIINEQDITLCIV